MSKKTKTILVASIILIAIGIAASASANARRTGRRSYSTPRATIIIPTTQSKGRMIRHRYPGYETPRPTPTPRPRTTPEAF